MSKRWRDYVIGWLGWSLTKLCTSGGSDEACFCLLVAMEGIMHLCM